MAKEFINKADISDTMIERPISFSVGKKRFFIYPPTLGKIQLFSRLIDAMGIDANSTLPDILSKTREFRNESLRLISYATLSGNGCLNENKVAKRIKELRKIDDADISSLLIIIISFDKTDRIIKQYGIDTDAEQMKKIVKVKEQNKNSFSFGGRSPWGALIDCACERYGWSYQYVLWGISYSNLQLLLADQIKSVYLSDKERKNVHLSQDKTIIRADDPDALEQFIKTQNWR